MTSLPGEASDCGYYESHDAMHISQSANTVPPWCNCAQVEFSWIEIHF